MVQRITLKRFTIMAKFILDVELVMRKKVVMNYCDSLEQAKAMLEEEINERPFNIAHSFDECVGHKILAAEEK